MKPHYDFHSQKNVELQLLSLTTLTFEALGAFRFQVGEPQVIPVELKSLVICILSAANKTKSQINKLKKGSLRSSRSSNSYLYR